MVASLHLALWLCEDLHIALGALWRNPLAAGLICEMGAKVGDLLPDADG